MLNLLERTMHPAERGDKRPTIAAAVGVLAAIGASSCCILPLALFGFGVTGAWIGKLTAMAPYQPYFVVVSLLFLGSGLYLVYRKSEPESCEAGSSCGSLPSRRVLKAALWCAMLLVVASIAFPVVAPLLLEA